MNYLFLSQTDVALNAEPGPEGATLVVIVGSRAGEVIKDHDLREGITISCVIENLGRGKVRITCCSQERVEGVAKIEEALPSRLSLDLVVAYSRPQTLKKLFQLSSGVGVRSLSFVKTENVEPSYLKSKSLNYDEVRRQLILGCEQAGDGKFPEIYHFKNCYEFLKSTLIVNANGMKLFGDISINANIVRPMGEAILFLGPESGFTEEEKALLRSSEFIPTSLGPRVLRVETAATMLIGAILANLG